MPDINWTHQFSLGDHWAGHGVEGEALFSTWSGPTSLARRNADLVDIQGAFGVHCRVCGLVRGVDDLDIRQGFVEAYIRFGPNVMNGVVTEANISGYSVVLVTACHEPLTPSLTFVKTTNHSLEGTDVTTNPCDCPDEMYEAHVLTEVPTDVEEMRLMVVPVTAAGDALHVGLTSHPLIDFWTTTTTTSTTSTTNTSTTTTTSTSSTSTSTSITTTTSSTSTSTSSTTSTTSTTSTSTTTTTSSTTSTTTSTTTSSTTTTTTTTSSTTTTTGPVAVLEAVPRVAQLCKPVSFSGVESRCRHIPDYPLEYKWAVGPQTPSSLAGKLQDRFQTATNLNEAQVTISPEELESWAKLMGAQEDSFTLQAVLTVINFEGTERTAQAAIEVYSRDLDPIVRPRGPRSVSLEHPGQPMELEVTTEEQAPACNPIITVWEYQRQLVPAGGFPRETWSEWALMRDSGLTDESRLPNVVRVPPMSFLPDSLHRFRFNATFDAESLLEDRPGVVFTVTVGAYPDTVAVVEGPSRAAIGCGFMLDASRSMDPLTPSEGIAGLTFEWSCLGQACTALSTPAPGSDIVPSMTESVLRVEGKQLPVGIYQFSVRVGREAFEGADTATKVVEVTPAGSAPPARVSVPWASTGRMPSTAPRTEVVATITENAEAGCVVPPGLHWRFALVESPLRTPLRLAALLDTSTIFYEGEVKVFTFEFPGNLITPGYDYAYVLLQAPDNDTLAELQPGPLTSAGSDEDGLVVAAMSLPFVMDEVPKLGHVTVEPLEGEAARTEFTVQTSAWFDEDVPRLEYAFYYFPLAAYYSIVDDIADRLRFTQPEIEWLDPKSPRYWVALGGVQLRSWSRDATLHVVLRGGDNFLVVRARDVAGLTGSRAIIGPTVNPPTGGLIVEEVQSLLSTASAANDAEQIWMSAYAVIATMAAGQVVSAEGTDSRALAADIILSALELSTEIMEVSNQTVQQLTELVATFVLSLGPGALPLGELSRASGLVARCLELAVGGGLSSTSGHAVLGSISALSRGVLNGSRATEQAAAAEEASRLLALVSRLGEALLTSMRAGESQELSSLDAGVRLVLAKASLRSGQSLKLPGGLEVPASSLQPVAASGGRRLAEASTGVVACDPLAVQQTEWAALNPQRWAAAGLGYNDVVAPSATVKLLELRCGDGDAAAIPGTDPLVLPLTAGSAPTAGAGFWPCPVCLRFDEQLSAWTANGSRVDGEAGSTVWTCKASGGGGLYTMIYELTPLGEHGPQGPLNLVFTTPAPTTTITSTATNATVVEVEDTAISGRVIGGIVVGSLAFVALGLLAAAAVRKRGLPFVGHCRKKSRVGVIGQATGAGEDAEPLQGENNGFHDDGFSLPVPSRQKEGAQAAWESSPKAEAKDGHHYPAAAEARGGDDLRATADAAAGQAKDAHRFPAAPPVPATGKRTADAGKRKPPHQEPLASGPLELPGAVGAAAAAAAPAPRDGHLPAAPAPTPPERHGSGGSSSSGGSSARGRPFAAAPPVPGRRATQDSAASPADSRLSKLSREPPPLPVLPKRGSLKAAAADAAPSAAAPSAAAAPPLALPAAQRAAKPKGAAAGAAAPPLPPPPAASSHRGAGGGPAAAAAPAAAASSAARPAEPRSTAGQQQQPRQPRPQPEGRPRPPAVAVAEVVERAGEEGPKFKVVSPERPESGARSSGEDRSLALWSPGGTRRPPSDGASAPMEPLGPRQRLARKPKQGPPGSVCQPEFKTEVSKQLGIF